MPVFRENLNVQTPGAGTHEITESISRIVNRSRLLSGTVTVFCQHTSCSLVLMENADPTARRDLEAWMNRLVRADDPHFEHTQEGPDDMPSHIKMALTRSSETIPIDKGELMLGVWQGIFLWEHRTRPHSRTLIVTVLGE